MIIELRVKVDVERMKFIAPDCTIEEFGGILQDILMDLAEPVQGEFPIEDVTFEVKDSN